MRFNALNSLAEEAELLQNFLKQFSVFGVHTIVSISTLSTPRKL